MRSSKVSEFSIQLSNRFTTALLILILSFLVTFSTYLTASNVFGSFFQVQYDDAFVTYRYSWNLAQGDGLRFNMGDQTNSASSLLFTALLALLGFLFSPEGIPRISLFLSLLSLAALNIVLWKAIRNVSSEWTGLLISAFATINICLSPYFQYWLVSGMETIFFIALLISVVVSPSIFIKMAGKRSTTMLGASLFAALSITRVEGFIVALTVASSWLIFLHQRKAPLVETKLVRTAMFSTLLAFGSNVLFNFKYYGQFVGDPVRFKPLVNYYASTTQESLTTTLEFIWLHNKLLSVLLLLSIVIRIAETMGRNKIGMTLQEKVLTVSFLVYFAILSQVPHSDFYRYQMPLFVIGVAMIAFFAINSTYFKKIENFGIYKSRSLIGSCAIALTATNGVLNSNSTDSFVPVVVKYLYVQEARISAGKWLESNSEPGSKVLAADLGALAFYNPSNTYIDSGGLVNRELIQLLLRDGDYAGEIRRREPDYLADTAASNGLTSSEVIFDNPQKHYVPTKTQVYSSCKFSDSSTQVELEKFPTQPMQLLYVKIAKLSWRDCE